MPLPGQVKGPVSTQVESRPGRSCPVGDSLVPVVLGQPLHGEHRQLLVQHHAGPGIVGPDFRHLEPVPVPVPVSLYPVAVGTEELDVLPLGHSIVGQGYNLVRLEAQVVGLVEPAARADAPLRRAGGDAGRVGDMVPAVPDPRRWGGRFS